MSDKDDFEILLDLRDAVMADNQRLERERDNLQTHLDLQEQALADMTRQRDEARTWARRMMRERDAVQKDLDDLKFFLSVTRWRL